MRIYSEDQFEKMLKNQRRIYQEKLILFKTSRKKYLKSCKRWTKENLLYFSIIDEYGSWIRWNSKNKNPELNLIKNKDGKFISPNSFVLWLMFLKSTNFIEAAFLAFKSFLKESNRDEFTYFFKFTENSTAREIAKKIIKKDQNDIKKLVKIKEELLKGQEEYL